MKNIERIDKFLKEEYGEAKLSVINAGEVIPSEQVSSTRSAELGDKVRDIIENSLK